MKVGDLVELRLWPGRVPLCLLVDEMTGAEYIEMTSTATSYPIGIDPDDRFFLLWNLLDRPKWTFRWFRLYDDDILQEYPGEIDGTRD